MIQYSTLIHPSSVLFQTTFHQEVYKCTFSFTQFLDFLSFFLVRFAAYFRSFSVYLYICMHLDTNTTTSNTISISPHSLVKKRFFFYFFYFVQHRHTECNGSFTECCYLSKQLRFYMWHRTVNTIYSKYRQPSTR